MSPRRSQLRAVFLPTAMAMSAALAGLAAAPPSARFAPASARAGWAQADPCGDTISGQSSEVTCTIAQDTAIFGGGATATIAGTDVDTVSLTNGTIFVTLMPASMAATGTPVVLQPSIPVVIITPHDTIRAAGQASTCTRTGRNCPFKPLLASTSFASVLVISYPNSSPPSAVVALVSGQLTSNSTLQVGCQITYTNNAGVVTSTVTPLSTTVQDTLNAMQVPLPTIPSSC